jgi:hypothetical protein
VSTYIVIEVALENAKKLNKWLSGKLRHWEKLDGAGARVSAEGLDWEDLAPLGLMDVNEAVPNATFPFAARVDSESSTGSCSIGMIWDAQAKVLFQSDVSEDGNPLVRYGYSGPDNEHIIPDTKEEFAATLYLRACKRLGFNVPKV